MKLLLTLAVLAGCLGVARAQTFDQYGGDTALTCTAQAWFTLQKVGSRWYYCTPAGHVFIAQAAANVLKNGNPTYDCQTNSFNSTGTNLAWVSQGPTYPHTYAACINVNNAATWTPGLVCQDGLSTATAPACMNGTKLTQEANLPAVDATAGSWYYDGAGNLYVHTTTGDSPANHATMDYPENTYSIFAQKYNDVDYNWAWQTLKRLEAWKFNTTGQDSGGQIFPWDRCNGCVWPGGVQPINMPMMAILKPAEYASENSGGFMQSPLKDLLNGTNNNYTGWRGGAAYDSFDPGLNIYMQSSFTAVNQSQLAQNNPWIVGFLTDDSDFFTGMIYGPDFAEGSNTSANVNIGFATLITSPLQTFNNSDHFGPSQMFYPDPQVYTKASYTNPAHGTCAVASVPCSLRDFLYDEYSGSIASLDTAWGANYTSWDSAATCFGYANDQFGKPICPNKPSQPAVSLGTGDNTTKTFSACLGTGTYPTCSLGTPISPFSVQILVAGTPVIGVCPWFAPRANGAPCGSTVNLGYLMSSTPGYITAASTVNYSTGALTVTFGTAPASGAALTVNFATGGWMAGGTGLTDENGSNPWVGSNNACLEGADPLYPNYFVCNGGSGVYLPYPSDAFRIQSITVSGGTTTIVVLPPKTGAYTLANGQSLYISGSASASCNGGPYVRTDAGGTTATTFTISTPAGCNSTATAQGWVNSALAHDVDQWIAHYAARYFKTMHDDMRMKDIAGNPTTCLVASCWPGTKVPYLGVDNFGEGAYSQIWKGAKPYIYVNGTDDSGAPFIGMQSYRAAQDSSEFLYNYQYITHYLGDIPIFNSTQSPDATPDSSYACYPSTPTASTQSARGQQWYDDVNQLLTNTSANGDYQVVGTSWWAYQDFQLFNQGLVSLHDNAYDGAETSLSPVACDSYYSVQSGYKCGGEQGTGFGDVITKVTAANQIWTGLISPSPQFSYSPSPVAFGTVNVGSSSPLTITVTNGGNANLVLGTLGTPSDAEFTISADLCSGQTLAANGTCTFTLTFAPASAGAKTATISVPDNAGNPDSVSANGTGQSTVTYTLTISKVGTGSGTVTSTDSNINCGATCSHSGYAPGTQVTLNATPASKNSFIGWSGGCSGTGSCVVTLNADTTITATFNQNTPRGRGKKLIF